MREYFKFSPRSTGWRGAVLSGLVLFLMCGLSACRPGVAPSPTLTADLPSGTAQAIKIYTAEAGVYDLNAKDLQAAGLPADSLLDITRLRLSYRNRSQAFWVDGQGKQAKLTFYAQASQSLYSDENVYVLEINSETNPEIGSGAKDSSENTATPTSSPISLPPDAYQANLHLEQNKLYNPQVESGDHWLWASLAAPQKQSYDFNLDSLTRGAERLVLEVWASTEATQSPDHHLLLKVNGQPVADEKWDGKGRQTFKVEIQPGILREGANQLEIDAPGDTGVLADITFLDWLDINYPRRFVAQSDRLDFISPGGDYLLKGFSGLASVYDLTDPENPIRLPGSLGAQDVLQREAGHHYLAVGPQGVRKPLRLERVTLNPDLRAQDNGADYLVIGPPDLLAPLQPWVEWRQQQGLKVVVVTAEAAYDQFGSGFPEPEAIRSLVRYAVQNWQPAPRFLLLVGDGSYDPKGYLSSPEANRLPTFLVSTVYGGQTASDVVFSEINEDLKPALAVGRLPARQPQQITVWVEKILKYEQALASSASTANTDGNDWQKHILAIADGQEPNFRSDAQAFLYLFPAGFQTELFSPPAGSTEASVEISQRINQGDGLVAYFGHGSINMWGKDRLFSIEDVSKLTNGDRLPLVFNLTCLAGLFTHPTAESLAEALLWKAEGGAVDVLAPTSLTLPTDQSILSQPLVKALLATPQTTLGEALLAARRQTPTDSPGALDVMQTFLLFGDPALRFNP
jgi:hypothetical protein